MTKAELIKALAADLKESAARNRMQRKGGNFVEVDCLLSTPKYMAYGEAKFEYCDGLQVSVECVGGLLSRKAKSITDIGGLIINLLQ